VPASQNARARVRAEITAEIIGAAQDELALVGAAALSLRAVARRLEMVPSALYRYFPSRDALLTALIIESYERIGDVAARASLGDAPMERWLSLARGVRDWAQAHPHEWALVYGSPVPGYQAPRETVEAALGITRVVADILCSAGVPAGDLARPKAPEGLAQVVEPLEQLLFPGFPPEVVVAGLMAWTELIGMISLELFGHYKGATTDFEPVFMYAMRLAGTVAAL
jgi:AcrR family transcriptional regulator